MSIQERLDALRARMAAAARRAHRDPEDIVLVAVSKGQPAAAIREAYEAGQRAFGENYAQELVAKAAELAELELAWHFIGGLQRNKVKDVLGVAHTIHTVDRLSLADAIDARARDAVEVLIEVNVSGEAQKSGVSPSELVALAAHCASRARLRVAGLMTVPEAADDPEATRAAFAALRALRDDLVSRGLSGPALSMGMSHDFEVAIEEGATIVRVGTALFGPRARPST